MRLMKHVRLAYHHLLDHLLRPILLLISLTAITVIVVAVRTEPDRPSHLALGAVALALMISAAYLSTRLRPVYLLDFACYVPPPNLKLPLGKVEERCLASGKFAEGTIEFQLKVLARSGLGNETYVPEELHRSPPCPSMASARLETEQVVIGALDALFATTGVDPKDVGILVVNCSIFNPTPSLSALVVSRYKLRNGVRSFNLGGMGCSAGAIAVNLARDLLQLHRSTYAVVVSTENITSNWYVGSRRSMLIPNCLFRVGAAALMLSNRRADRRRAKYELAHVVRTHHAADDGAYRCVYQQQDEAGNAGVSLSKELIAVAGGALRDNLTALGPLVLPLREQVRFVAKKLCFKNSKEMKKAPQVPNFKLAFEHLCIHAGGKTVIGQLEEKLALRPEDVEASRMTLHRFGNTSSSSIWYELAYIEEKGRVRKGDRVWQVAFGSGFKCNSVVWRALRNVEPSPGGPWRDCIHRYPVAEETVDLLASHSVKEEFGCNSKALTETVEV